MSQHLANGASFPSIEIPRLGGGLLRLPAELGGSYGVVLIYRGQWCPLCNVQIAEFVSGFNDLSKAGIKVAAFSVDKESDTAKFCKKHSVPFALGHSADVESVRDATGAYESQLSSGHRFLETTGFVLAPDGTIDTAVYSSRAIGRLVPHDVLHLVAAMKRMRK